jgi:hypothetical protein
VVACAKAKVGPPISQKPIMALIIMGKKMGTPARIKTNMPIKQ